MQSQIDTGRAELKALEASRIARIEEFRRKELGDSQKLKNDPLARMTAYQELKNDPKDGTTIIWFSWMTKLLVIFLEVVPVVAKIFFSPPSVYAARIQDQVGGEGARARRESDPFRDKEREIRKSCSSRDRSALEPRGRAAGEGRRSQEAKYRKPVE